MSNTDNTGIQYVKNDVKNVKNDVYDRDVRHF